MIVFHLLIHQTIQYYMLGSLNYNHCYRYKRRKNKKTKMTKS